MFPCHAAVARQSIPTFKVSNNCRATESSPATNLKRGTTSRRSPREVICKLSASKSRCQYSSEMLETNGFYQTLARQRRSSVRSSSLHVRDGSSIRASSQPQYRLCGVVTSSHVLRYRSRPILDRLTADLLRITYPWQQAQAQRPWPKR